jgi:hypothetical protein
MGQPLPRAKAVLDHNDHTRAVSSPTLGGIRYGSVGWNALYLGPIEAVMLSTVFLANYLT